MQHTPYGDNVMFTGAPVHAGFSGGDVVNVSPAKLQLIGHAVAVIVYGDRPQSKIGEGRRPLAGGFAWKTRVDGSMAYSHGAVASYSRSTARDSCAF